MHPTITQQKFHALRVLSSYVIQKTAEQELQL